MTIDKEIYHPIHLQHKQKLEYTEIPFTCDGCKEAGIGLKYNYQQCEFDLHKACAVARPTINHSFYRKCKFEFHYQPSGEVTRICDACRKDVMGFVYHCKGCGFDLHPCFSDLPQVLDDGQHNLYRCLKLSGSCHRCGGSGSGWSYRSRCKTYNLHVSCVKELLVESWQAMYLNVDKNKVREMQMAGGAVRLIVSAILGDPTAIVAAVIGGFISK